MKAHKTLIGEPVDGPHNGPAPPAWSIQIQPDGMFKNQEKQCKVMLKTL